MILDHACARGGVAPLSQRLRPLVVRTVLNAARLSPRERVYIVPSLDLVIVRTGEASLAFDDSIIANAIISGLNPPS